MEQMSPVVERLVRLMVMLPPERDHPLWTSVIADGIEVSEAIAMRWYVGDAAQTWPPAAAHNLATAVLTAFGAPSERTLEHLSAALAPASGQAPHVGMAWVNQARAAAINVLADERPLDEILQYIKEHWTLRP